MGIDILQNKGIVVDGQGTVAVEGFPIAPVEQDIMNAWAEWAEQTGNTAVLKAIAEDPAAVASLIATLHTNEGLTYPEETPGRARLDTDGNRLVVETPQGYRYKTGSKR